MTRVEREKMHREILRVAVDHANELWYEDSFYSNADCIGFTAGQLAKIMSKKLKYSVSKEDIRQALENFKSVNGIYNIPLKIE